MDNDNERQKPEGFIFGNEPLNLGPICRDDDFTLFVDAPRFRDALKKCMVARKPESASTAARTEPALEPAVEHYIDTNKTFDFEHTLKTSGESCRVRFHAALCYDRSFFSVTVRARDLPGDYLRPAYEHWGDELSDSKCPDLKLLELAWKPDPRFAATIPQVALLLHRQLHAKSTEPGRGLVLVAGRTGSGKTKYMNALLFFHLSHLLRRHAASAAKAPDAAWPRRPHVVAIGDPVETLFFQRYVNDLNLVVKDSCRNAAAFQSDEPTRVVDFTARSIGDDVESVKHALKDALRETTSAVVVSELREPEDFRAALDFAATGHLIFATAHSGSLVDTMEKLIGIANVKTPSARSGLVHRLQAMIHLETLAVDGPQLTLPAMWRRNSAGVRNFVSEGLSSIQHRSPQNKVTDASTLGYYWAAGKLFGPPRANDALQASVFRKALDLDLAVR